MKVDTDRLDQARLPWRASLTALVSVLVASLGLFPTTAHAITRTDILTRAHDWVAKKVMYSQRAHFAGYRRDCSGFVSMAWKLGRSYTSRTIHAVATRIPLSKLQPGDAVHTPGHVAIFVRWANRARTRYVAMEESRWGHPAMHHERPLGRHATGLRYRHTVEQTVAALEPLTGISALPPLLGAFSLDSTGAVMATGSASATAAAPVLATGTAAASPLADAAPTLLLTPALQTSSALVVGQYLY